MNFPHDTLPNSKKKKKLTEQIYWQAENSSTLWHLCKSWSWLYTSTKYCNF